MRAEDYVYPFDWEQGLPGGVADAYASRDSSTVHGLARDVRRGGGQARPEELAAVMHALAFALDHITVMHERIIAYGAIPGANKGGRPYGGASPRARDPRSGW